MSDTPKHAIIEVGTGTIRYVDFTAEEIQQRELDAIQFATEKTEREAAEAEAAAKRENVLNTIANVTGLSAEDIKAALS